MGTQNPETRIQNASIKQVGCRPDVLIWRQHVGHFRHLHREDQIISVGSPGMADSLAVVRVVITQDMVGKVVGVAVAPEFKTAKGKQGEQQAKWQRAFEARGGVYRLVRSPEEMDTLVDDVQHGRPFKLAD